MSFGVASLVGLLQQWNYNIWYGSATQKMIDTTIQQLESGNSPAVADNLKWLKSQYHPTYENRANFDQLIDQYVSRFDAAE